MEEILERLMKQLCKDGLFKDHIDQVENCKQNEKRILLSMKICQKYNIVPPKVTILTKNAEQSKKYRDEGNQLYSRCTTQTQLRQVCELYSKSAAYSPNRSVELSLAYANKSAVLFRLEQYEECVRAIDDCLALNYPNDLRLKVLLRKTECLVLLRDKRAKKCYRETVDWIKEHCSKDKDKILAKLDECFKSERKVRRWKETDVAKVFQNYYYKKTNSEVPCSSDSLTIKYNESFGRYLVATRDIRPGEILAREAPYCSVLGFTKRYLFCWRCLEIVWHSVPCEHCVYVVYCSDACKDDAWKRFHELECKILPHILALTGEGLLRKGLLTLRLIIFAVKETGGFQNLMKECKEVDKCTDPREKGFSNDGKFLCDKYRSIYSLSTTIGRRDNHIPLYSFLNLSSLILYLLATETTFLSKKFVGWKDICENVEAIFIGSLIFHNLDIIDTNCYSAKESLDSADKDKGAAIFSFFSLINHSCVPNIAKNSRNDYDFLYALHPIKKGEQIFINYISDCQSMLKMTRQQDLFRRYHFVCQCDACCENWPLPKHYPDFQDIMKKRAVSSKLLESLNKVRPYLFISLESEYFFKSVEEVTKALEDLRSALEILLNHVSPPCSEVEIIIRRIRFVFERSKYIEENKLTETNE